MLDQGQQPGHEPAKNRWRLPALLLAALIGAVAAAIAWRSHSALPPKPTDAEESLDDVLAVVNPGYVGIEVCAECHGGRAKTFEATRHYLACRTAAGGATAPGFAAGQGVRTRTPGLRFEMTRSGDEFFANRIQETDRGEQRAPNQIGLVYGSAGKRDEMYFTWQDDRLFQLAVAWLYPSNCWATREAGLAREATASCLECHNTWMAHVPGTANQFRREGMLLGVTCERCHGPGREHVEYHREHPDERIGRAIVHPAMLSRERLMDVCGQCHGNVRPLGRTFAYRPGEPLGEYYHVVKTTHPEGDTANQVRYLGESKCFQKSEMTCVSCHDPHQPGKSRNRCLGCHTAAKCPEQPRLPEAIRGDCVGCHMPSRLRMNFHFYTTADDKYVPVAPRTEHRIGIYPETKKTLLLAHLRTRTDAASRAEADRLAAELARHGTDEGAERLRAGRYLAAMGSYREVLRIGPNPEVRRQLRKVIALQTELDDLAQSAGVLLRGRPDAAVPVLEQILELQPDSAFAHGELGWIYLTRGRREEGVRHLQAVAQHDPNDAHGAVMLAWSNYLDGRTEEAAAMCARASEIDPSNVMNHRVWGLVLLRQQRWAAAEKEFRKAIAVKPTEGESNRGLSEALRQQGRAEEAVRFARRSHRFTEPPSAAVLLTLADAYAASDRGADARATLEQALIVAEDTDPVLASTIRRRLAAP